ncbi:MAG: DUF4150 domain-containing protein [bacterium]
MEIDGMGVTINVNSLSLVHKGSSGIAIATIPDVCKTPSPGGPVPIPYPNISRSISLSKGSKKVNADGGNMIAVKGSEFSLSNGDEAGTVGGIKSSTNMKEAKWLTYSFDVKIEGNNASRLTDKMTCNHGNTVCLGGVGNPWVGAIGLDRAETLLCEILCRTIEKRQKFEALPENKGKTFRNSSHAKELYEKEYKRRFLKLGKWVPEKKALVSVAKGALGETTRKVFTHAAIKTRLLKEAVEKLGKEFVKKKAKSAVLKFVPGLNTIMLVWDVVDLGMTIYDATKMAQEFLEQFDTFSIQPDMAKYGPDGEILEINDYKFPGDSFTEEQLELYEQKTGQKVKKTDDEKCKCKNVKRGPKGGIL